MAWHVAEKCYWTYGRVGFRSMNDMVQEKQGPCVATEQDTQDAAPSAEESSAKPEGALASFREFYRSRDGLITTFEDAQGHFTSVISARLC